MDAGRNCTKLESLLLGDGLVEHLAVLAAAGDGEKKPGETPPAATKASPETSAARRAKEEPEGEGRRGKAPGEGRKLVDLGTRVDYAPMCCGCNRQGADALKHPEEVFVTSTFALRPLRKGSSTNLGICLMANRAGSVTSTKGRLCGHVVCPSCAKMSEDRLMCPCCNTRLEERGAAKGGGG